MHELLPSSAAARAWVQRVCGVAAGEHVSAPGYRLISYLGGDRAQAGVLIGDRVFAATALLGDRPGIGDVSSVLGLLRQWDIEQARIGASI
jgi:hypothetical protein